VGHSRVAPGVVRLGADGGAYRDEFIGDSASARAPHLFSRNGGAKCRFFVIGLVVGNFCQTDLGRNESLNPGYLASTASEKQACQENPDPCEDKMDFRFKSFAEP